MRGIVVFSLLVFISSLLIAQPYFPDDNQVFTTDVMPRVDITIEEDSLSWMYDHTDSYHEFKAQFIFTGNNVVDTIENIGFRFRGNTSRNSDKKSFKVSFNTFDKGREFYGLQKMNLNGEHNDPSVIRSFLAWELANSLQLIGSRSNHVELYINGRYYGLYINVEHVDDKYLDLRFNHDYGNLYKCLYPANLEYLGNDKSDYKRNGYELKTNVSEDNFDDLIHFVKVIEGTEPEDLPMKLEPIFNVNGFIRYLAFETFIGHWDAYSFGKNNYYLYSNQLTGKMEFIPYDVDNTFGIDWYGIDWAKRDIYHWWNDWESRPLTEKIMSNQVYKDRYSYFLNELITAYANPSTFFPFIDNTKARIDESAKADNYRAMDYGWSFEDYSLSYSESIGDHVKYGIKTFISERIQTIKAQLQLNGISPIIENVYHNSPSFGQDVLISAKVTDDTDGVSVVIYSRMNNDGFKEKAMLLQEKNNYRVELSSPIGEGTFEYYLLAIDKDGKITREPAIGAYVVKFGTSNLTLRINEFLASNSSDIYDNYGQTEDWIELYNYGTETVSLNGLFLTDDALDIRKWELPNVNLLPDSYYMIWADDDKGQGDNHAKFKLSKNGDFIGLFDSRDNGYLPIDTFSYQLQKTDTSFGMSKVGVLLEQDFMTPGGTNNSEEVAYVTFMYDMSDVIRAGDFNSLSDNIQIASSFNDFKPEIEIIDNNEDGLLRATIFGLSVEQSISYKAIINGDLNQVDKLYDKNLTSGNNVLEHKFNLITSVGFSKKFTTKVYPNPVRAEVLFIELSGDYYAYEIRNSLGVLIEQSEVHDNLFTVAINAYKSGIYYVSLFNGVELVEVHKVIVY